MSPCITTIEVTIDKTGRLHSLEPMQAIITFGMSSLGRLLAVFHTHHPGVIRIISARRVTRAERKLYEEN